MDVGILAEPCKIPILYVIVGFFSIVVSFYCIDMSGLGLYLIILNIRVVSIAPTIGIRASGLCLGGRERN